MVFTNIIENENQKIKIKMKPTLSRSIKRNK